MDELLPRGEVTEVPIEEPVNGATNGSAPLTQDSGGFVSNVANVTSSWESPIEFDAESFGPPPPLDAFPGVLAEYCRAVHASVESPMGFSAAAAIGISAICCQGRARVEVGKTDHVEPLSRYIAAIGLPGEKKTATQRAWMAPLQELQKELSSSEVVKLAVQQNATELRVAEQRVKRKEAAAAEEEDPEARADLQREAAQIRAELPDEIAMPRLYVDDCTPEELGEKLALNGGTHEYGVRPAHGPNR